MDNDKQQTVEIMIRLLKQSMKRDDLVFGLMIDKEDVNNSSICFIEKDSVNGEKFSGCSVTITELNKGLL